MPRGIDDRDPTLTEGDRRAIDEIRRELDAEFGRLEESAPVGSPRSPQPATDRQIKRVDSEQLAGRAARPVRPSRRPALSTFLLGTLVGGLAGGLAGAATVQWLGDADVRGGLGLSAFLGPPPGNTSPAAGQRTDSAAALDVALRDWLQATKRADIQGQMRFYPPRVPVYYTWRDVSRDAVRDEKLKVFGAATRLEIATDTPTIEFADGGRSAVTRFRKRYVIEGPVIRRRGEVVQELRWTRSAEGWRIVAERDAEVLAP
jgi:hypothetical protein